MVESVELVRLNQTRRRDGEKEIRGNDFSYWSSRPGFCELKQRFGFHTHTNSWHRLEVKRYLADYKQFGLVFKAKLGAKLAIV